MKTVEQLCDDICLVDRGSTVLYGPVRDVKKSLGSDTLKIEFASDGAFPREMEDAGCG